MALNPLISSEIETAAGKKHHDSSIAAANYSLNLLGERQIGPAAVLSSRQFPAGSGTNTCWKELWIDVEPWFGSKAILRENSASGSSAVTSFANMRRLMGSGFRMRIAHLFRVRLYGEKILTTERQNYIVNVAQDQSQAPALVQESARGQA